ncbi:helix-turn-helix domain-containing protein [Streptomyces boninensis]|uniref:helix-turn-helix domain-containing protein n=1 Tax=Streptomyces boninensis TaxID=2039455 RepID=UPI003B22137C
MNNVEQLRAAREMRSIKQSSGLSYEKLAARTHYSRSSWERFLNGKMPVTPGVIEQFAAAVGSEAAGLLRVRPQDPRDPEPAPAPPSPRSAALFTFVTLFAAGVAVGRLLKPAGNRRVRYVPLPSHSAFPHPTMCAAPSQP